MRSLPFVAILAVVLAAPVARGEDPKPAGAPPADAKPAAPPALASDADAAAAVAAFKEEFKAKGLKGEDKTAQRDWAMSKISKIQHAQVVEELADVVRGGDEKLRRIAVLYLGDQKALPGSAGRVASAALEKNRKDPRFVLSALRTIGGVGYLGAEETLRDLMKGDDFLYKKAAIVAAGETRDIRLLPDLLRIVGVTDKGTQESGGSDEVVVEEGYSWEGAEASVDTGTAGDGDQQAAEAQVEAELAANEAAAAAGAGAGGSKGSSASQRGKGGASRSPKELAPHVLKAVSRITGQSFQTPQAIVAWLKANRSKIADERSKVAEKAKAQP
jgi:hypothetical protein